MLTNRDIFDIALAQSSFDCNCRPTDFLESENLIVPSVPNPKARAYLPLPFACDLVSYGSNVVAQVREDLADVVKGYLDRFPAYRCFETPNLHVLNDALIPYGYQVCFMAEYFLPDITLLCEPECAYPLRSLTADDFEGLYTAEWSNALCKERKQLDVMGVGAYDGDRLIGLAACSADCEQMYQIGIDVLPSYRRQGIASALTSRLAREILAVGKVPFYCAAWSNIPSVRNAVKCGFRPAWVELTAREIDFVRSMNTAQASH